MKFFNRPFFTGGAHPPEEKDWTKSKPIEEAPLPHRVVHSLVPRSGKGAEPLVSVGDTVLAGQKIGRATHMFTAHVHASISGKVSKIVEFPHAQGFNSLSVIIESDGEDRWIDTLEGASSLESVTPDEIKHLVTEAGIVGMGGAEFPTSVKLSPPPEKTIKYVILNGAECEPYLTSDHRTMLERPHDIVGGLKLLMRSVSAQKGIIGVENNKPDAILTLRKAVAGSDIEVRELPVKYPQGGEKLLIKTILGVEVPTGGLPMDVGALIQNVGTACAIFEAVKDGIPLVKRVVTVTGPAVKEPKNLRVRLGTSISDLIEICGGFVGTPEQVIMGGPMMGQAQFSMEVPVLKGTSGVVIISARKKKNTKVSACIRCGRCINSCPLGLSPSLFGIYGERGLIDKAELLGVKDCMECGVCTYVCPSNRPITQLIKSIKSELVKRKTKTMGRKKLG